MAGFIRKVLTAHTQMDALDNECQDFFDREESGTKSPTHDRDEGTLQSRILDVLASEGGMFLHNILLDGPEPDALHGEGGPHPMDHRPYQLRKMREEGQDLIARAKALATEAGGAMSGLFLNDRREARFTEIENTLISLGGEIRELEAQMKEPRTPYIQKYITDPILGHHVNPKWTDAPEKPKPVAKAGLFTGLLIPKEFRTAVPKPPVAPAEPAPKPHQGTKPMIEGTKMPVSLWADGITGKTNVLQKDIEINEVGGKWAVSYQGKVAYIAQTQADAERFVSKIVKGA